MSDRLYDMRPKRIQYYARKITSILLGNTPELRPLRGRLDYHGVGELHDLYSRATGADRVDLVRSMGEIVTTAEGRPPIIVAQVVDIAASLDISQIEPNINHLASRPLAQIEPIKGAVQRFQALRSFEKRNRVDP